MLRSLMNLRGAKVVVASVAVVGTAMANVTPAMGAADSPDEMAPVQVLDQVVIPVPHEIFAVLDDLGIRNWKGVAPLPKRPQRLSRPQAALVMGAVVAEGFLAVQASDKNAIKDLGPEVLELAEMLGVKDEVAGHARAMVDGSDAGDWDSVRAELDKTQTTVRTAMEKLQDEELSQFVSLGGWVRGTEAVSHVILDSYSNERAELLRQPDLAVHFSKVLSNMGERARRVDGVPTMEKALVQLRILMNKEMLTDIEVAQIEHISNEVVAAIYGAKSEAKGGEEAAEDAAAENVEGKPTTDNQ
ncbi:hypothetical protein [Sulfuriroseicoccus oceanibius]|uniref:Uncharacterized protein n=1 Tax=Sulfuriroseicoccus oceanibius TaxID=2707525 RepID=A0A6B3LAT4_9BACT|nr:hypothetical protein [Sulfuriroseicoccus oceanibius]QQL44709.1 hypothetical protein G3M56_012600 [Sulfuriroseicoccus oceanibius]